MHATTVICTHTHACTPLTHTHTHTHTHMHTTHPHPHTHTYTHPLTHTHMQSECGDTSISIDRSLHHHNQLQAANSGLDELIGNASGVISSLKNQSFTLKVGTSC